MSLLTPLATGELAASAHDATALDAAHRTLRHWTLRHTFQFRVAATAHIGTRHFNKGYIARISYL